MSSKIKYSPQNFTIHYWIDKGADKHKLVMGMPMYGQSFTLRDATKNGLNQQSYGGGEAGRYTRARGFLAYYEVQFVFSYILTCFRQGFQNFSYEGFHYYLLVKTYCSEF